MSSKKEASLEALRRVRTGGASALDLVHVDEEEVYDVLDEDAYRKLVEERRSRGGVVIEDSDDEGLGYSDDDGEEWEWTEDASTQKQPGQQASRRKKTTKPLFSADAKKKNATADTTPVTSQRLERMFRSTAAKPASSAAQAAPDAELSQMLDDLMDNPLDEEDAYAHTQPAASPRRDDFSHWLPSESDTPSYRYHQSSNQSSSSQSSSSQSSSNQLASQSSNQSTSQSSQSSTEAIPSRPGFELKAPITGYGPTPGQLRSQLIIKQEESAVDDDDSFFLEAAQALEKQQPSYVEVKSEVPEAEQLFSRSSSSSSSSQHGTSDDWPPSTVGADVFRFYWLDACELAQQPGTVFLFGKVSVVPRSQSATPSLPLSLRYKSCCLVVRNITRKLYIVPRYSDAAGGPHDVASLDQDALLDEVESKLLEHGIKPTAYRYKFVTRSYAFDVPGVPQGEACYLKVKYPYSLPTLPDDFAASAQRFSHVFGARTRVIEHLVVGRKLMGPGWLQVPLRQLHVPGVRQSHCNYEFVLDDAKLIDSSGAGKAAGQLEVPPLRVMSVQCKTTMNPRVKTNEVVMISLVVHSNVSSEHPTATPQSQFQKLTLVRKMDLGKSVFPRSFVTAVQRGAAGRSLRLFDTEQALLSAFLAEVLQVDPDVLVGHNFLNWTLDLLLVRAKKLSAVKNWSVIGRLRRSALPKLNNAGPGGGQKQSSFGAREVLSGRLLCDTYLTCKEFLHEKNYSLGELARSQLGYQRDDMEPEELVSSYGSEAGLHKVIAHCLKDAELSMLLQFKLNILPLTKALCSLAGHLWSRSLLGARAERIESLLLHEFHRRKFVVPDAQRSAASAAADGAATPAKRQKRGKAAYSGGLVLAPKAGLYTSYTLLLDFASLYPSIIQEHNICWTTVVRRRRSAEQQQQGAATSSSGGSGALAGWEPSEAPPAGLKEGVLPSVIKTLVDRRRAVKQLLPNAKGDEYAQLDNRQLALKLLANSMYGCLGFSFSRFFAMPLAELITRLGRETLQDTVDTVTSQGLNVIYGDTDSIMVSTGLTEREPVVELGKKVAGQITKKYRRMELEIDGIFRTLLLLKKKKYAALIEHSDGTLQRQLKGLDIVRRDWCGIAAKMGEQVIDLIFRTQAGDEVVPSLHDYLRRVAADIRADRVPLKLFAITKGLTKDPSEYTDAASQPHVQVALRMRQRNEPVYVGEHIPYIICAPSKDKDDASSTASYAMRAHSQKEIEASGGQLTVDYEWYFGTQIHPVISRLCSPIEGTDAAQLAFHLGLDPSRFAGAALLSNGQRQRDSGDHYSSSFESEQRDWFRTGAPLSVRCSHCHTVSELDGLYPLIKSLNDDADSPQPAASATSLPASATSLLNSLRACYQCKKVFTPAKLVNCLRTAMRKCVDDLYDFKLMCLSDTPHTTRDLFYSESRHPRCPIRDCGARVEQLVPPRKVFDQLVYFRNGFDHVEAIKVLKNPTHAAQINSILVQSGMSDTFDRMVAHAQKVLDLSAFANLDARDVFAFSFV